MSTFKTEAEQVDDLKRWVKSYGPSILIGILLALVIIYGRQFWQKHQASKAQHASVLYQQLSDAYIAQDNDSIKQLNNQLIEGYAKSPYTQYAQFMQAKTAVAKSHYKQASAALNWIIAHTPDDNLKNIALLRLAKVQIADQQAQTAITTLKPLNSTSYAGLAQIITGDAWLALDKPAQAKQAYQAALTNLPNSADALPTLQMRIDNLGA